MLEINEHKTKEEAHKVLDIYRRLVLMAGAEYSPNVTQSFSADIKGVGGKANSAVETEVLKKLDLKTEVDKIDKAVDRISNDKQYILYQRYLRKDELSDVQIYMDMNVSEATFYRRLRKAQIAFAYAYDNGRLLIGK